MCLVLDASSLQDSQATSSPEPEPLQSQDFTTMTTEGEAELLAELQGFRALYLSSAGVLIFLAAAIFFRSRKV